MASNPFPRLPCQRRGSGLHSSSLEDAAQSSGIQVEPRTGTAITPPTLHLLQLNWTTCTQFVVWNIGLIMSNEQATPKQGWSAYQGEEFYSATSITRNTKPALTR